MVLDPLVIGVGSPVIDVIADVEDSFIEKINAEKGGMTLVDEEGFRELLSKIPGKSIKTPGGSAGNTLFTLARLGNRTRFLGKIGNCPEGNFYRERFKAVGGDASSFKVGQVMNGQCLCLVTPGGERTFRTYLGAASSLCPDEVLEGDFSACSHAHIEGYLLFDQKLLMHVLDCAKAAECTISIDLASFEVVRAGGDLLKQILKDYVDVVFANEAEAAAFTGLEESYSKMAEKLCEYCKVAVVKMGAQGAYICSSGTTVRIEPVPVESVIDTTGAGDLWAAGFLHGWLKKCDLSLSGKIGSILGAAVVQVQGSTLPEDVWRACLLGIDEAFSIKAAKI